MNNGKSFIVVGDSNLERLAGSRWADLHRDGRVVGFERPPMVAHGMEHVIVRDTVLAGACFDAHSFAL